MPDREGKPAGSRERLDNAQTTSVFVSDAEFLLRAILRNQLADVVRIDLYDADRVTGSGRADPQRYRR
jgi:hypothetical protein